MDFRLIILTVQMIAQYKTISRAADALYILPAFLSVEIFTETWKEELRNCPCLERVKQTNVSRFMRERGFWRPASRSLPCRTAYDPHNPPDHQP